MKKIVLAGLFAAAALTACKDKESEEMMDATEDTMENMADRAEDMEQMGDDQMGQTVTYTREQTDQMAGDFESNVQVEDNKIKTIKGYEGYDRFRMSLMDLKKATPTNMKMKSESLRASFNNFKSTIPGYLRIDDVNDAIRDVEKELTEYEKEMAGDKASEKNNLENMEELQEAFDDLEEEIIEARQKFIDNREDAMEEYMEEINSSSNQTMSEKYRDATEEYNEEIKD